MIQDLFGGETVRDTVQEAVSRIILMGRNIVLRLACRAGLLELQGFMGLRVSGMISTVQISLPSLFSIHRPRYRN